MSTDRFDLLHDEWLADYLDSSTAYLKTACGIDVPVEPEVQAILDAWEAGSEEKPWRDAGSDEEELTRPGKSSQVGDLTRFGKDQAEQVTDLGKSA